jgi:hypothetical protein
MSTTLYVEHYLKLLLFNGVLWLKLLDALDVV